MKATERFISDVIVDIINSARTRYPKEYRTSDKYHEQNDYYKLKQALEHISIDEFKDILSENFESCADDYKWESYEK